MADDDTPEEVALRGFQPDAQAYVVNIRYEDPDHAVVEVGFPDKVPTYGLNLYHHADGWSLEIPPGRSTT